MKDVFYSIIILLRISYININIPNVDATFRQTEGLHEKYSG